MKSLVTQVLERAEAEGGSEYLQRCLALTKEDSHSGTASAELQPTRDRAFRPISSGGACLSSELSSSLYLEEFTGGAPSHRNSSGECGAVSLCSGTGGFTAWGSKSGSAQQEEQTGSFPFSYPQQ